MTVFPICFNWLITTFILVASDHRESNEQLRHVISHKSIRINFAYKKLYQILKRRFFFSSIRMLAKYFEDYVNHHLLSYCSASAAVRRRFVSLTACIIDRVVVVDVVVADVLWSCAELRAAYCPRRCRLAAKA